MTNFQKVKLKNNVIRGSLLSISDIDYRKFIDNFKELTIIKIHEDRVLLQNEYQKDNWFYMDQIKLIS